MPKSVRLIVTVDWDKCTGCGRCVKACLTGALQLVDGKSRLVDERRCDGFGSCISVCPNNAIRLEMREAEDFDWSVVNEITFENLMKKLEMASAPST
ncbi:MAG: 4Fe-4S binding protein [Candidatus Bathyarchaeota archaeon]|nr:4Fe-4S binding protein [Candidatus Bathyarchaeota archaeon]